MVGINKVHRHPGTSAASRTAVDQGKSPPMAPSSFERHTTERDEMAVDGVGIASYVTSSWLSGILWRIYRNGQSAVGSYRCPRLDSCSLNTERFEQLWQEEVERRKSPSFVRVADRFVRSRHSLTLTAYWLALSLGFLTPSVFILQLLKFIQNPEMSQVHAIAPVTGIFVVGAIQVALTNLVWSSLGRTAVRFQSGVLGLVVRKILATRMSTAGAMSSGEILNVIANDGAQLVEYAIWGDLWIPGVIVALMTTAFVFWVFGVAALVGASVFVAFYGAQYVAFRLVQHYRSEAVAATDRRVQQVSEILNNIKTIKLFAWEKPFQEAITEIREKERGFLEKKTLCNSAMSSLSKAVPTIATIATLLTCILLGFDLDSLLVYPCLGVIGLANSSLSLVQRSASKRAEYKSSARRIQKTLLLMSNPVLTPSTLNESSDVAISILGASFTWHEPLKAASVDALNSGNKASPPALSDITLEVKKGQLVGICGAVGSGKSSLLSAILGEIHRLEGTVATAGSVVYVAQQPWIMNGSSVTDNIAFGGSHLDEERYLRTIHSCELSTAEGNLSGGQKQRIHLARAMYVGSDIYLLDDPLSAVDQKVGRHIFRQCIRGDGGGVLLFNKTILFVSHQLQFLQQCDSVVVLRNGRIVQQGDPSILAGQTDGEYSKFLKTFLTQHEGDIPQGSADTGDLDGVALQTDSVVAQVEPSSAGGHVRFSTYKAYVDALGGFGMAMVTFVLLGLVTALGSFSTWWLSNMLSSVERHANGTLPAGSIYDGTSVFVYGMFVAAILIAVLIKSFVYVKGVLRAATILHQNAVRSVIHSPMRFFEVVPLGKIINIFSKDQNEVDNYLPQSMEEALSSLWITLVTLLMVVLVFPWFLAPLIVVFCLFLAFASVFHVALRELKRAENASRSPFFGHVETLVQGLTTIRSYKGEASFERKFSELQDTNSGARLMLWFCVRWITFRLDMLSVLITTTTAVFVVFTRGIIPVPFAGLALTFSFQLGVMIHYLVCNMAHTEAQFTNVERIASCSNGLVVEEDTPWQSPMKQQVPRTWPASGQIVFDDVCMRYRDELPLALSAVSFQVQPGEKIGIVGRTGSGKSSLGAALFRLVEPCRGRILVDDVDISRLRFKDLRGRLAVIPQDPVLFIGNVRFNLDPFGDCKDDKIWSVLERTHLKDKISALNEGLMAPVVENGENFSVGEKQLLCLARALLRKCKILFLDEATASVDACTDALVQHILHSSFSHCTILTIAHRIRTVLDYDRIMVLHQGKVVEFDTPHRLRNDPTSHFSALFNETSQSN